MRYFILILAACAAFAQSQLGSPVTILPPIDKSTAGCIRIHEDPDNGTNVTTVCAHSLIPSNWTLRLPQSDGGAGQCLSTLGGSTGTQWIACAGSDWVLTISELRPAGAYDIMPFVSGVPIGGMGSPSEPWNAGYFDVLDTSGSGLAQHYIATRQLRLVDQGASSAYFTTFINLTAPDAYWELADDFNFTLMRYYTILGGLGENFLELHGDLRFPTTNTFKIGSTSLRASTIYATTVDTTILGNSSGTTILVDEDFLPATNLIFDLGSPSFRWGTGYFDSLDSTGGCPLCGVSDGGTTTFVTNAGDNFAIGTSSTSYKFEVAGSSKFGGSLEFATDNAYSIGTSGVRPSTIFAYTMNFKTGLSNNGTTVINSASEWALALIPNTNALHDLGSASKKWGNQYMDGRTYWVLSSINRISIASLDITLRNASDVISGTWTSSSGNLDILGSYHVGGVIGLTLNCTTLETIRDPRYVGGILTEGTCGV